MRPEPARKAFARGRRLAKRLPDVQQTGGFSRLLERKHKCEKPPDSGGFSESVQPIDDQGG
jgi:hypothetical protein